MKAHCIVHTGIQKAEVAGFELRDPQGDEVLVENYYTCVSPGTELRCLAGKQQGAVFPYIAGYAGAGIVVKKGPDATMKEGTRVFCPGTRESGDLARCWGGHVSHAVISEKNVLPLPGSLSLADASLATMGAIAYHGFRLSRPMAGERVAVIGLGILGQFSARFHAMPGTKTVATDLSKFRVEKAISGGVTAIQGKGTLKETFASVMPEGADIVVDVTGVPAVLKDGLQVVKDLAWDDTPKASPRYLLQGSYPDMFEVSYRDAFFKEVTFLTPRNYQGPDIAAVIELMGSGEISVAGLAEIREPVDALKSYGQLADRDYPLLTVAFEWKKEL